MRMTLWASLGLLVAVAAQAAEPELIVQNRVASNSISFSPDGKLLAAVGSDLGLGAGVLQLWDLSTGKLLREIGTIGGNLSGVTFTSGGSAVATCCEDGGAELWDVKTGERRRVLSRTKCRTISASPDGQIVALNGETSSPGIRKENIQLVRVADGKVVRTLESSPPWSVAFSPDGKTLVSGGSDHRVRVWDVGTWKQRYELSGHDGFIKRVSISSDGTLLASSDDKTIRIWSLNSGATLRVTEAKYGAVAFSPAGRVLYLGVYREKRGFEFRLVDGPSGDTIQTLEDAPPLWAKGVVFSPNGEVLAVSGKDLGRDQGGIQFWNVRNGKFLRELISGVTMSEHVAFSPRGEVLAVEGTNGVRLWDLQTLRPVPVPNPDRTDCNTEAGLEFTPTGETLLAGLRCGRLDLLSLKGEPLRVLRPPTAVFVTNPAISPDGTIAVANTPSCMRRSDSCQTGYVAWDLASGNVLWTYASSDKFGWSMSKPAISPDGQQVAITDKQVQLLDARTGALIKRLAVRYLFDTSISVEPRAAAYSKDGRLAVGLDFNNIIEFVKASDDIGKYLTRSILDDLDGRLVGVGVLRYSPDGRLLVAGRHDGMLLFIRGAAPMEVRAHKGAITSIDFSPDGRLIATAGRDAAVRIWEGATARLLATLVQVGENEYIIAAPSGAYTASPGAFRGVAFRVGEHVYPFEQFDLQLNRPDQVLTSLGTGTPTLVAAYRQAWLRRLQRMGVEEKDVAPDYHTPTISIVTKDQGISTRNRLLSVRVRAEDKLVPLERLKVVVNDVPLWGARGWSLDKRTGSIEVPIQIELSAGLNRIRISAMNAHMAESPSETIEIVHEAPPSLPDTYLLVIGVSKYRNDAFNLQYAAKDAADISDLFQQGEGAPRVKVLRILDNDATRERIVSAKDFLSKARVDDRVIVFAAGHGLLDERLDYYFATTDIDFDAPAKRGLSFQAFEELLDGIASRHKLLLVDTCNSGEVDPQAVAFGETREVDDGMVRARAVRGVRVVRSGVDADGTRQILSELFADLRRGSGSAIISSTGGSEFAFESERWRNGVFTYSMLNGLRSGSADANNDGRVSVSELRNYVISSVQRLTGGAQRPTSRRESLAFDFEISSEDFSLRALRGVTWDNADPYLCGTAPDVTKCQCMMREARKYFPNPYALMDSMHQMVYASEHGEPAPPGSASLLAVFGKCGKPAPAEKAPGPCPEDMVLLDPASDRALQTGLPSAYCIDKTEVTVREFKKGVASGACIAANTRCDPNANYGVPGREENPMNCVNWSDATDYCAWTRKRLPSQLEWRWAAGGGRRNTKYPWGDTPPEGDICWHRADGPRASWLGTCPAGSSRADVTPQGVRDMAANVGEWTSTPGSDDETRVVMGGGWADTDVDTGMSADWSEIFDKAMRHSVLGFRCAKDADPVRGHTSAVKK